MIHWDWILTAIVGYFFLQLFAGMVQVWFKYGHPFCVAMTKGLLRERYPLLFFMLQLIWPDKTTTQTVSNETISQPQAAYMAQKQAEQNELFKVGSETNRAV